MTPLDSWFRDTKKKCHIQQIVTAQLERYRNHPLSYLHYKLQDLVQSESSDCGPSFHTTMLFRKFTDRED